MRVVLMTTFQTTRKEPLAGALERIHSGFAAAALGEPVVRFSLADGPVPGTVSSVDRVLKRFPDLERFVSTAAPLPGTPAVRLISNRPGSPAAGERLEFPRLLDIANGVPRSFPFHTLAIHLTAPAFGAPLNIAPVGAIEPGVLLGDSWWVNGRTRSLTAVTCVDVQPDHRGTPAPPEPLAPVFTACGKIKKTVQLPIADDGAHGAAAPAAVPAETAAAIRAVVVEYRSRLAEIVDRAALPHDLPPASEALATGTFETSGPKKPALVRAFGPLGYDCHGESGTFTLRRRTSGNLTIEVSLDVGSWSNSLTAGYRVSGLGFSARLPLPVAKRALEARQYKIGGAQRWQQIVENLAALVAHFDRTFVPAIEADAGPSPEWYRPES
jgi:hypothetical protein